MKRGLYFVLRTSGSRRSRLALALSDCSLRMFMRSLISQPQKGACKTITNPSFYFTPQLRKENQYLNRLLDPSSTFSLFPQLPPEIRIPIWEFAFRAPYIHLIIQNRGGRSTVNNVMQSCKEAREHGLEMKLPYYQLRSRTSYKNGRALGFRNGFRSGPGGTPRSRANGFRVPRFPLPPDSPKYYMNPDVDTILFERFGFAPSWVFFFCGLEECAAPDAKYSRSHFHGHCEHRISWSRLALCYDVDDDRDQPGASMRAENLDAIVELNLRKILVVIGGTEHFATHNVSFVPPRSKYRDMGRCRPRPGQIEVPVSSWAQEEKWLQDTLEDHKVRCVKSRQEGRSRKRYQASKMGFQTDYF